MNLVSGMELSCFSAPIHGLVNVLQNPRFRAIGVPSADEEMEIDFSGLRCRDTETAALLKLMFDEFGPCSKSMRGWI